MAASVQIRTYHVDNTTAYGSGVAIRTETADQGRFWNPKSRQYEDAKAACIVLTCKHCVTPQPPKFAAIKMVWVRFPSGESYAAEVLATDDQADLAALWFFCPQGTPHVAIAGGEPQGEGAIAQIGYPHGEGPKTRIGKLLASAWKDERGLPVYRNTLRVDNGDSGSGVFADKLLFGIVSTKKSRIGPGEAGIVVQTDLARFTEACFKRPLLPWRKKMEARPSPQQPGPAPTPPNPTPPNPAPDKGGILGLRGLQDRLQEMERRGNERAERMEKRLEGLPAEIDRGVRQGTGQLADKLHRIKDELKDAALAAVAGLKGELPGLIGGLAHTALPWTATILAPVTGGASLGILGLLGAWRLFRRRRDPTPHQGVPAAAPSAAPPAAPFRLDVEEHSPIERDDRQGRELLRLDRLEGRDPLQDAIGGRIVRTRLEALAEGRDLQKAQWASELMRDIDRAYNEVAPTKFNLRRGA